MRRLRLERSGSAPIVFGGDLITIGRSPSNMLVVSDTRVSNLHGEIVRRDGDYFYRDLGSTNGSLVRSGREEVVVDGKRVREAPLKDGDQLHLGDRARPVVLDVSIEAVEEEAEALRTVVAHREVTSVEALGTQVVENPLASRQTLTRLFNFFVDLGLTSTPRQLAEQVGAFALDLLSRNAFVAVFLKAGESLERRALLTRDPARTPIFSFEQLQSWFPEALAGRASTAIEGPVALVERMSELEMMAACPLPSDRGPLGLMVVGRMAAFSQFDLDVLSLVTHHAALQLEKLGLIAQLEEFNRKLANENRQLRNQLDESIVERPMIGESLPWKRALKQAELVARTSTGVLILGETGTGKEILARFIHRHSDRSDRRFAAVNCGALADTLLESELFGHVKGAFTGADRDKKGLFRAADGGTLFLDEIGDVSTNLQVKLLRVLESGEVTPVGTSRPVAVDVRVIAATHRDLEKEVAAERFREDLFYRVNVFPIEIPPLRERPGDIALMARHFLEVYGRQLGKATPGFDPLALERLESYGWPGNVRQLQNEIHRAVVLADEGTPIGVDLLSDEVGGLTALPPSTRRLKEVMARLEEQYIRRVLAEHEDNRTQTAKALGISRQALTEKLRRYDLVKVRDA